MQVSSVVVWQARGISASYNFHRLPMKQGVGCMNDQKHRHNVWANNTYGSFTQLPSPEGFSPLVSPCRAPAKRPDSGICQLFTTIDLPASAKLGRLQIHTVGKSSHGCRHHSCSHRWRHSSRPCRNSMAFGFMVNTTLETMIDWLGCDK